ncbi:uncharacterized protein LOC112203504 [Rosa chinensis]|uniref:uncharacterized protein LOC112203504 n=1 Tax=Rosa chinensis TaxID=74649 RepID=UPI000D088388|nr:uncharacterized protein LOC112203504 [Rosa chinensis]
MSRPFCKFALEDDINLFKDCKWAKEFWFFRPLSLRSREVQTHSLLEWVLFVLENNNQHQRELFFRLLWALWTKHNNAVWTGNVFNPLNMAYWASKHLEDYRKVHTGKEKKKQPKTQTRWQHPPSGRLKLNVDGPFHVDTGQGGIGAIIRDENGMFLAAIGPPFSFVRSAFSYRN